MSVDTMQSAGVRQRHSVRTKIAIGFALSAALTLVTAVVGWQGIERYEQGVEIVTQSQDIVEGVSLFERSFSEFREMRSDSKLNAAMQQLQDVEARIQQMSAVSEAGLGDAVSELRASLEDYANTYKNRSEARRAFENNLATLTTISQELKVQSIEQYDNARNQVIDIERDTRAQQEIASQAEALIGSIAATKLAQLEASANGDQEAFENFDQKVKELYLAILKFKKLIKGTEWETVAGSVIKSLGEYRRTIKDIIAANKTFGEVEGQWDAARNGINESWQGFQKAGSDLADLFDQISKSSAFDAENQLKLVTGLARIQEKVALAKLAQNNFLIEGDNSSIELFDENVKSAFIAALSLKRILPDAESKALLKGMTNSAQDFRRSFKTLSVASADLTAIEQNKSELFTQADSLLLNIEQQASALASELGGRANIAIQNTDALADKMEEKRVAQAIVERFETSRLALVVEAARFNGESNDGEALVSKKQAMIAEANTVAESVETGNEAGSAEQMLNAVGAVDEAIGSLLAETSSAKQSLGAVRDRIVTIQELMVTLKTDAMDQLASNRQMAIGLLAAGTTIALIIGMIAAWTITRIVARPISQLTQSMHSLASGDLETNVPGNDRQDELGEMARAVETFKSKAINVRSLEQSFEKTVAGLATEVQTLTSDLCAGANEMHQDASNTGTLNLEALEAGEVASEHVACVVSATEEMQASIDDIATNMKKTSDLSRDAMIGVRETSEAADTLSDTVKNISAVIELVQKIAEKTNLLALNATIEAARAGKAGKGFSVVAQEVKALASQTAQATDDINQKISVITEVSDRTTNAVVAVRSVLDQLEQIAGHVAGATQQQASSTAEIVESASAASVSLTEGLQRSKTSKDASDAAAQRAKSLLESTQDVHQKAEITNREVGAFLDAVRSA